MTELQEKNARTIDHLIKAEGAVNALTANLRGRRGEGSPITPRDATSVAHDLLLAAEGLLRSVEAEDARLAPLVGHVYSARVDAELIGRGYTPARNLPE